MSAMKKLSFKKGEIIFKNVEPASHMYLVISGEVGLFFSTDPKIHISLLERMKLLVKWGD